MSHPISTHDPEEKSLPDDVENHEVDTLLCKKCGYSWTPRKPSPKACPECKTRKWSF